MEIGEKIPENWRTIKEKEAAAKRQTGDPEAGFNPSLFFIGKEGRHLPLQMKYRGKKGKKGQETFTKSYKEISAYALFCPFSGKPLYTNSQEISDYNESMTPKL